VAEASKTNSFGTFLETIEKRAEPAAAPPNAVPPPAPVPGSGMTEVSRRVLQVLAAGPATVAELRERAGLDTADSVLDDLTTTGFVERVPGRTARYALTAQGQAVVQLLSA